MIVDVRFVMSRDGFIDARVEGREIPIPATTSLSDAVRFVALYLDARAWHERITTFEAARRIA